MFTIFAVGLLVIVVVAVILNRNELRTLAIALLSVLVMLMMIFGYAAARRHSVDSFDVYGEELAQQMISGVQAYDKALVDVRIGIVLAFFGLLILAATGWQRKQQNTDIRMETTTQEQEDGKDGNTE